jgi:hypothetical protein
LLQIAKELIVTYYRLQILIDSHAREMYLDINLSTLSSPVQNNPLSQKIYSSDHNPFLF